PPCASPSGTEEQASPPCWKAPPSPEASSAPSPKAAGSAYPSRRRSPTSTAAPCGWNPPPVAGRWRSWSSRSPDPVDPVLASLDPAVTQPLERHADNPLGDSHVGQAIL